jgi:hypothetical protein
MAQSSPRRRFWTYMAPVLALAALVIAGLRVLDVTQDHQRSSESENRATERSASE